MSTSRIVQDYQLECAAKAKKAMRGHNRDLALAWIRKAQSLRKRKI